MEEIVNEMGSRISKMRLTTEQRLAALERDNVVLHDTVKLLHRLLKEQRQLIKDYITQQVMSVSQRKKQNGDIRPEDALYTFVCKRRFDAIERRMDRMRRSLADPRSELRAG